MCACESTTAPYEEFAMEIKGPESIAKAGRTTQYSLVIDGDIPVKTASWAIEEGYESYAIINETKKNGGRVICVGTTSCRTLESATGEDGILRAGSGWTEIFIYPGYKFKILDALITNFHLPESTLLMLISALAGRDNVMAAYEEAVKERYRFFSFGDAMFIS